MNMPAPKANKSPSTELTVSKILAEVTATAEPTCKAGRMMSRIPYFSELEGLRGKNLKYKVYSIANNLGIICPYNLARDRKSCIDDRRFDCLQKLAR